METQETKGTKGNKGYHKLIVWQKAHGFVLAIYDVTEDFPRSEEFGLKSQIRRAAVSVVLNVVEGYRRSSRKDYLHFLNTADASLSEIEAAMEIAKDLQFLSGDSYAQLENKRGQLGFLLSQLIKSLKV